MGVFTLAPRARIDLLHIADYTMDKWGAAQRRKYLEILNEGFQRAAARPMSGMNREDVRAGYRSVKVRHHLVFYREVGDGIEIVRVLHESMDVGRQFDE